MRKKRLDLLSYIKDFDFSYDCYVEALNERYENSIYIANDKNNLTINGKYIKNLKFKIFSIPIKFGKTTHVICELVNLILIHIPLLLLITLIKRPNIILVNTYVLPIILIPISYILRINVYYICADWFPYDKKNRGFFSRIINKIIFPWLDYISAKYSYGVINYSEDIIKLRNEYWNKEFNSYIYPINIKPLDDQDSKKNIRKNICFSGRIRQDSGLDILVRCIKIIRSQLKQDIKLIIIGEVNDCAKKIKSLSKEIHTEEFIIFKGYLERTELNREIRNSFCGVNLITEKESYTNVTIPGKVYDYFKNLTPVLATKNIGKIYKFISENRLGKIVEDSDEEIISAVIELFNKQEYYRSLLISAFSENTTMFNFLEMNKYEKIFK